MLTTPINQQLSLYSSLFLRGGEGRGEYTWKLFLGNMAIRKTIPLASTSLKQWKAKARGVELNLPI